MLWSRLWLSAGACTEAQRAAKACDVRFVGPSIERGTVIASATPQCDTPPISHTISAVLQLNVGGEWMPQGRNVLRSTIPDATGFLLPLAVPCVAGQWRAHAVVQGTSPNGIAFNETLTSSTAEFTDVQCAST